MIEIIKSMVYNGSWMGPSTYEPWLPFYGFIPFTLSLLILGVISYVFGKSWFYWIGSVLGASIVSIPITMISYYGFAFDPLDVTLFWLGSTLCIAGMVHYYMCKNKQNEVQISKETPT